ncbi:MAG: hypothetical protein OWS74_05655 [Firmicutes bacterium]|nr:hypothetical protein [Bacillota bacterium]
MSKMGEALHPLSVLGLLFLGIAGIFSVDSWIGLQIWAGVSTVFWGMRVGPDQRIKSAGRALIGGIMWAGMIAVNHKHSTLTGALFMGEQFAAAALYAEAALTLRSLSSILYALDRIGKQSGSALRSAVGYFYLSVRLALRFFPEFLDQSREVYHEARMRRQLARAQWKWTDTVRLLVPLLMQSLLLSSHLAEAVWTRGWRPDARPAGYAWHKVDGVVAAGIIGWLSWKIMMKG